MQDQSAVTVDIIRKFEKHFLSLQSPLPVWVLLYGSSIMAFCTSLRVNAVATLLSIVIGAAVYAVLLLLLKGLNEQEILRFPKGRMLADVAKKMHLLK